MMRLDKFLCGAALCVKGALITGAASAAPLSTADILADWTAGPSPIGSEGTTGAWAEQSPGVIDGTGNHAGSLVSDFTAVGNFMFSAVARSNDNDGFGLLWGVQDLDNHYRFTWSQNYGENNNTGGANGAFDGFKIVKETGGAATTLFSSDIEYAQGADYDLKVQGVAGGFRVIVGEVGGAAPVFDQTILDAMFASGKVGIHDLFQSSHDWSGFDFAQGSATTTPVPIPAGLPLLATALAGLGLMTCRRRR